MMPRLAGDSERPTTAVSKLALSVRVGSPFSIDRYRAVRLQKFIMKILLTGVSGRVGCSVFAELRRVGHDVVILARRPLEPSHQAEASRFVQGNLLDEMDWKRSLEGVDTVVHLAGIAHDAPDVFAFNVASVHALCGALVDSSVKRIVFASSNCVLGHCGGPESVAHPAEYLPIDEEHPLKPASDYGLSKLVGEEILQAAARRHQVGVISMRLAWVWSEVECQRLREQSADRNQYARGMWAYLHEDDCASAFRRAVELDKGAGFDAVYLSAADTLSPFSSVELAETHLPHLSGEVIRVRGRESFFSWRGAQTLLGYQPIRSWRG